MNIQLPDNVKQFLSKLNQAGIPLPMIQDCISKQPSMTYTLTLMAGVMVALSVCHVGTVDYERACNFLQMVGCGYLGRQVMKHVAPITNSNNDSKEQN